jgi:hypothetical protein
MSTSQFHLAFTVRDLDEAKAFYLGIVGCTLGRQTENHVDLDMFGHHVVAHLGPPLHSSSSEFDGHQVPVPHFGLNLPRADWAALAARLQRSPCRFREYPHTRMAGQLGEHDTLFVYDPSNNALEFKSFRDPSHVFAIDRGPAIAAPPPDSGQVLRPRVEAVIHRLRGSVEDALLASGFIDSIGAIELVSAIQAELGLRLDLQLRDVATVASLVAAIGAAMRGARGEIRA